MGSPGPLPISSQHQGGVVPASGGGAGPSCGGDSAQRRNLGPRPGERHFRPDGGEKRRPGAPGKTSAGRAGGIATPGGGGALSGPERRSPGTGTPGRGVREVGGGGARFRRSGQCGGLAGASGRRALPVPFGARGSGGASSGPSSGRGAVSWGPAALGPRAEDLEFRPQRGACRCLEFGRRRGGPELWRTGGAGRGPVGTAGSVLDACRAGGLPVRRRGACGVPDGWEVALVLAMPERWP